MSRKRYRVSAEHVIWAYEDHIIEKHKQGMSVAEIGQWLRDEFSLHVADNSVRAVLGNRLGT